MIGRRHGFVLQAWFEYVLLSSSFSWRFPSSSGAAEGSLHTGGAVAPPAALLCRVAQRRHGADQPRVRHRCVDRERSSHPAGADPLRSGLEFRHRGVLRRGPRLRQGGAAGLQRSADRRAVDLRRHVAYRPAARAARAELLAMVRTAPVSCRTEPRCRRTVDGLPLGERNVGHHMATVTVKPDDILHQGANVVFSHPDVVRTLRRYLSPSHPATRPAIASTSALDRLEPVTRMMEVCGIKAGEELRRERATKPSIGWSSMPSSRRRTRITWCQGPGPPFATRGTGTRCGSNAPSRKTSVGGIGQFRRRGRNS